MSPVLESLLNSIPQLPNRTDPAIEQALDLVEFAKRLGMRDVAAHLEKMVKDQIRAYGPRPLHPEQRSGEVLLGNMTHATYKVVGWKTKRHGSVAYDDAGATVPERIPVFVSASELADKGQLSARDTVKD